MARDTPYIGTMDKLIYIHRDVFTKNDLGEQKSEKVLVSRCWAAMADTSGKHDVEGEILNVVGRTYTIRRNDTIARGGLKMTVTHDDIVFRIDRIEAIKRSHLMLYVIANE